MYIHLLLISLSLIGLSSRAIADSVSVFTENVSLSKEDPNLNKIGKLRFRGGVKITSTHKKFGGISGLTISKDGHQFTAVGDQASWFYGNIHYETNGDLKNVTQITTRAMRGTNGKKLKSKKESDAEAIAIHPAGDIFVSFERKHRIVRYRGNQAYKFPKPPGLKKAKSNSGLEVLTDLPNNGLLAFTENLGTEDLISGWLWQKDKWSKVGLQRSDNFKATGATTDSKGNVFILFRKFSPLAGVEARIVKIKGASIQPGAKLAGEVLAQFREPLTVDNFEGIHVRDGADGTQFLYIISDDNFSPLQDTYLLMFEIRK